MAKSLIKKAVKKIIYGSRLKAEIKKNPKLKKELMEKFKEKRRMDEMSKEYFGKKKLMPKKKGMAKKAVMEKKKEGRVKATGKVAKKYGELKKQLGNAKTETEKETILRQMDTISKAVSGKTLYKDFAGRDKVIRRAKEAAERKRKK